ncbi:FAD-dependent oxidoreductase [Glycomyces sp. NPDC047369]
MTGPGRVLIVGASAAGLATAEALRRKGYAGAITLVGDEPHAPYDRPPLSKQVLSGAWEPGRAALRSGTALAALGIDLILGEAAVALEAAERSIRTETGRRLGADAVVVATGARARMLPGQRGIGGVHVLRTLDQALALRKDLMSSRRLVVVGEGVLGAEVAATARGLGVETTLAGPLRAPLERQVGPLVSGLLAQLHREHGVRLRSGSAVEGLVETNGHVGGVRLGTGEVLPAEAVVVAIGALPSTDWLAGSGLRLDNGVVCDAQCRAAEGIWAVGDVARWHHERLGRLVRFENRTNATEQAAAVAADILGQGRPYTPVPYFWTDQYDAKLQVHGVIGEDTEVEVVEGDTAARRFVARYREDGQVTAVLGWNMPKQTRLHRNDIDLPLSAVSGLG